MDKRITESEMLTRLSLGAVLLPPLVIHHCELFPRNRPHSPDAYLELGLPDSDERFRFILESKARATPQDVQLALMEARAKARPGERPMVQVPFLSPERLEELEREQASGVDLCGNGIVMIPGRLWVVRSGHPNAYRDSRPLVNPYRGRSALVGRALLQQPSWPTLRRLVAWIREQGAELSPAQASKAVQAMEEDLLILRRGGTIGLEEPQWLLDRLGQAWRKPSFSAQRLVKLPHGRDSVARLSSIGTLKWAMTGESTVSRYVTFAQGGSRRVAVSSLAQAFSALEATPESVPSFADAELLETQEPGFYFGTVTDENGIRWASRLQTWLELQAGDARQREAAADLRPQILQEAHR